MWDRFLLLAGIIAVCMLLLCIKVLFKKNGRFPNTHIGGSAAMRKRGISCVQSMDRNERKENPHRISETRKK